ncbi:class I SAM-dependent methyltransferase [Occultella kanbiaonis]|uniref:class I SAM-dependent methyltransferase n=1 Tax=Occultella kanbiaonis TaxID=2675754 RepID=UPI00143E0E49|nr:class I SAM-dependent methyltransferase [Occultella kanbiaonis]
MSTPEEIAARLLQYYADEMAQRADRPLGQERTAHVEAFADDLTPTDTVLEIGCGAGRDGVILAATGATYIGVDLSPEGVRICRELGLDARVANVTDLPFEDDSIDAAWSMSTLMHLTDDQFSGALTEIGRVVRSGGMVEVAVWGHEPPLASFDEHGRYFNRRSDGGLRAALSPLGEVEAFDTWDHWHGHRYQWARVRTL